MDDHCHCYRLMEYCGRRRWLVRREAIVDPAIVENGKGVHENSSRRSKSGGCIYACAIAQWCEHSKNMESAVDGTVQRSANPFKFCKIFLPICSEDHIIDRKTPSSECNFDSQNVPSARH